MKDKTSIINAAQKYAAKGHIDKAIAEWEKLTAARTDGNIHNTIGDLYLRKGSDNEATESFRKAADLFRKDGFYPKAIAIYKKILNILPNDVDALVSLAKLNADRGLTGNAIDHYYRAAELYNREGSTEKATMVVEKMLQLEPTDIGTRSKIAYLYFRIGLRERASNEYASIANAYLENDNYEKAKEFYDKAIEYDPGNVHALLGLSKLAIKTKSHDQAFDSLDSALALDPENKDILITYGKLAIDSDKMDDAKRALAVLIDIDPSDLATRNLVGTFHLKEGRVEEAWEELLPVVDDALDAERWSEAHEILNHFKEHQPFPAKERLLRICKAQSDNTAILEGLKDLADLHENEGSDEAALQLYKEALELYPDDSSITEKVTALESSLGITHTPTEPFPEYQAGNDEHVVTLPEHNEVSYPEMETVLENQAPAEGIIPGPSVPEKEEDVPQAEGTAEYFAEFETNTIAPTQNEEEISLSQAPETISDDALVAMKAEADFYVQQGLESEAVKIYEKLISAFPDNDEIANKLATIKADYEIARKLNESGSDVRENADMSPEKTKAEPSPEGKLDDDLQALFEQFEKPDEDTIDYEAQYVAGLDFKQQGLLEDAVKALEIAAKDPENMQRNSTMLALCYSEQGSYALAIAEFNKVLESMSPSASTFLHVKYELASAHMNNKDYSRALELFTEVLAKDRDFKDVSEKIASLEARSQQTQQQPKQSKKDRVSYI